MSSVVDGRILPTATGRQALREVLQIWRRERASSIWLLCLQGGATLAGLVGPFIFGVLVQDASQHRLGSSLMELVLIFLAATVAQGLLIWASGRRAGTMGARVLAHLRRQFLGNVLDLPLGVVERAGTGDLLTRATSDVDELSRTAQRAFPQIAIAAVTTVLTIGALVWVSPIMALSLLPAIAVLLPATRWYLARASSAYLRERAAQASVNGKIQESVEAGRTVEALQLGGERVALVDDAVRRWIAAERFTLGLRTRYFPVCEATYVIPLVLSVAIGGVLHSAGLLSLGGLTAAALYAQQLISPVDTLLAWLDTLQLGGAAFSRLVGVGYVQRPAVTAAIPEDEQMDVDRVRFAYQSGRDVLQGVSLKPDVGSRVAIVGPSGSGKSTLGLLLVGIYQPDFGRVTVGGVDVHQLPSERIRSEVVLLTQEHHVFSGTLRDNLRLATQDASDPSLRSALETVGASDWADELPEGLDTPVGSGGQELNPAQAQQLALARLILADPHTLVLDEATSLLNPRVARTLERSMAQVLKGRTVVAVSHRLHGAIDADLVVVVSEGRIVEMGPHSQLMKAGGSYAKLWESYLGGARRDVPPSL